MPDHTGGEQEYHQAARDGLWTQQEIHDNRQVIEEKLRTAVYAAVLQVLHGYGVSALTTSHERIALESANAAQWCVQKAWIPMGPVQR